MYLVQAQTQIADATGRWHLHGETLSLDLDLAGDGESLVGGFSYVTLPAATRIREGRVTGSRHDSGWRLRFETDGEPEEVFQVLFERDGDAARWRMSTLPPALSEVLPHVATLWPPADG